MSLFGQTSATAELKQDSTTAPVSISAAASPDTALSAVPPPPLRPRVGILAGGGVNFHYAGFPSAAALGVQNDCCGEFKSGIGGGFMLGAITDLPLNFLVESELANKLMVTIRATFIQHDGVMDASADSLFAQGGIISQGRLEQRLRATLWSLGGEAQVRYNILPNFAVFAGTRIGGFARRTYSQTKTITEPTGRIFHPNGTTIDTVANDSYIANMQPLGFTLSAHAGITYEYPLNAEKSWLLAPEMMFHFNLLHFVPNRAWGAHFFSAGVGLKYVIPPPPTTFPPLDTTSPPPSMTNLDKRDSAQSKAYPDLAVKFIKTVQDSSGKVLPVIRINVEDHVSRRVFPLLTDIFFEQGSDVIPGRYKRLLAQDTGSFTLKKLLRNKKFGSLDVYHELLNILGRRLNANPASTVTLTGCLGAVGNSTDSEEADKTLSLRRAESVRNYLRDTWGIATNRMAVVARGLPAKPSQTTDEFAKAAGTDVADNRRVEITSADWEIIKPVVDDDTLSIASFPMVRFTADIAPKDSIANYIKTWSLQIKQNDSVLVQNKGNILNFDYDWNIEFSPPRSSKPVQITLDVETMADEHILLKDTIGVEYLSVTKKRASGAGDIEKSEFRLVGFEFGNTGVTETHKRIIREFIRPMLNAQSTLQITGHTDAFGKDDSNQRLSQLRAEAISQEIGLGKPIVSGEGNKKMFYSNKTPEGRFYSRTVQVLAETPIK